MKLLVTGKEGQVARSLVERASRFPGVTVITAGRPEMDLADSAGINRIISTADIDIVISAAAYTAVDQAEDEPELAHTLNATGAHAIASAAAARDIPIIHLSTDYVFSGASEGRYTEDDATDPQCVYGRTKLAGELAVASANPRHIILRTAWVYSPFGKNFVKTMMRLAAERDEISVVSDQWGNPTSALDIADGIIHIAERIVSGGKNAPYGLFHLAGTGETNWSGFAEEIMHTSHVQGGRKAIIRPITTDDYPTKAKRPANSRLATEKLEAAYGWKAPQWQTSLGEVSRRILAG
ncbi:dTDP-4-dehydrorhamnose reductase [Phyllobacterium phragmitis]|uniref:dTDP-4-dehydrorhamnose reductase n=1 Tax=Phyllobacterium phragmitis TaxID=2670329 RepID=A0A2S9IMF1_9HYPH|nr:dTDP-4-dehydrorhamnose reductase [Phyllobacterium phragmitis]PRD41706.1 dTDP-4-dehydrorhamnose reductase [Phyllobacterium phragmitis]